MNGQLRHLLVFGQEMENHSSRRFSNIASAKFLIGHFVDFFNNPFVINAPTCDEVTETFFVVGVCQQFLAQASTTDSLTSVSLDI